MPRAAFTVHGRGTSLGAERPSAEREHRPKILTIPVQSYSDYRDTPLAISNVKQDVKQADKKQ